MLRYDNYFNDDESECLILEIYRDAQAAMEHAEHLSELSTRVLETVPVVLGESSVSPTKSYVPVGGHRGPPTLHAQRFDVERGLLDMSALVRPSEVSAGVYTFT
jgi:hypothetical protein